TVATVLATIYIDDDTVWFVILLQLTTALFPYTALCRSGADRDVHDARHDEHTARRVGVARRRIDGLRAVGRHEHRLGRRDGPRQDRKSTRLNSSHVKISYAVVFLQKKKDILVSSTT